MTVVSTVAETLTWIAGGAFLVAAVTLGLALHRRKLPVHMRPRRRRR